MRAGIAFVGAVLALIGAGAFYQFVAARRSARRYGAPGELLAVGDYHLHRVCAGSGEPPVFFESGVAASSLSWTRVLPDVAAFTRACAYDRAGLGWSEPSRRPRTVPSMIDELHTVIESVAPAGPVVLVGHSFGTLLASVYTAQYPHAIAGLVLLDPPSEWHEMTRRQARLLWGGIQLSRLGGLLARVGVVRACLTLLTGGAPSVPRNFVRMFGPTTSRTVERLVGEVRKLPPEVHPVVQALWCQPKCFRAMADHLAALEETAAAAHRVTTLDVPLVIVSSGDQPPEILATHRRLARLSSQGRQIVATNSGHWIQFDEPDLVVAVVREIVERARQTSAA